MSTQSSRSQARDVGFSRESVTEFVRSIEATVGAIDVLVNNAGVMPAGRFVEESEATTATGVTLTAVLPSVVNTELSSGISVPLSWLARVQAEDVARAILDSCKSRPKELAVPRWLGLYPALRPFIPERIEALARKLIRDDRALSSVDPAGRAAYAERVARQVLDGERAADGF